MKLEFLDYDSIFEEAKIITNHEAVDSKTKKFNQDGIFSELIFGKLDNDGIQYSCDCGKYIGKFYNNKECDVCNTRVNFIQPMVKKLGWIDLRPNFVINPIFYHFISKIVRKVFLNGIIQYDKKFSRDGIIKDNENEKNPYANIGLFEFREKFWEIIDYFYEKSKNKQKHKFYNRLVENFDIIFIDKIPVFSTILRPAIMMKENLVFDEINNVYNNIINSNNQIKDSAKSEQTDLNILPILANIQSMVNELFDKVIENIKGKTGFIRNNIMGNRVNYSARNVITPLRAGHSLDSIILPYLTFLELYKFQIINLLSTMENINPIEANQIWSEATLKFNEKIYKIMRDLIEKTKGGVKILFNRNPTINYGSIMQLQVIDVKKDYNDLTASISNNILKPLGGD
jgi:DNA-directed RNA polymerase beta' subunit